MADNSGGIGLLGVIIGAILVIALGAFFLGVIPGSGSKSVVDVNIKPPVTAGK
ncbi:hypothetical protein PY365_29625 [Roseiarcaceae bacterium H3SJ34-1]|uniref:hypothetical protein n=1 Tax=Terripilifer ovatus TaxID=3032367 RepID=UPI003AB99734|nr:hypothetical protein [Roseiarcaceae bacterium H3SJ34-1]